MINIYEKLGIKVNLTGTNEEQARQYYEACKEAYNTISNTTVKTNDPVNPNHYKQGGIECIDALKSATIGKSGIEAVCTANVIKYLWRYEEKNGLEDIHKAQWYLNRLEKEVSKNE